MIVSRSFDHKAVRNEHSRSFLLANEQTRCKRRSWRWRHSCMHYHFCRNKSFGSSVATHCSRPRGSSTLRRYLRVAQKVEKEIDTRIGKTSTVLRDLYSFVVTKLELSNTLISCQFLNQSLFRSSPIVVNLGNEWYSDISSMSGKDGFFASAQLWNS